MLPIVSIPESQLADLATAHAATLQPNLPEVLDGDSLLQLPTHPQVRHFVLFQLFQEWRGYMQRVRHPFFNYDAPAVQAAMAQLEQQLSHHLAVPGSEMPELLKKAVYNTLWLILNPAEALCKYFFGNKEVLEREKLERFAGFILCYDFLVQGLVHHYEKQGVDTITLADFREKLQKLAARYAEQVQPLAHYQAEQYRAAAGQPLPAVAEATAAGSASQGAEPVAPATLFATPAPTAGTPPAAPVDPRTPAPAPAMPTARMADTFGSRPSPNPEPGRPLRSDSIPLHKQFQYVQKVFGGDTQRFRQALQDINVLTSYEEAQQYLRTRIFNMPDNAHDEKVNEEFLAFVAGRFGA
ncbi:MAG: hypothetical protein LW884_08095 [Bacteroidetes bacterium]|jgi:hypothetical protein|nr:hypothetical protein [Bacteroidota bacterium]